MGSKQARTGGSRTAPTELFNLEKSIKILETPFSEACRVLGLDETEPDKFMEVENCIFFFDPAKEYVFGSAVIMGSAYGFYGIKIGANWLDTAGKLESQGFKQATDLERFTKPGPDFSISVYLYPDRNRARISVSVFTCTPTNARMLPCRR